jgi:hypothetical protein
MTIIRLAAVTAVISMSMCAVAAAAPERSTALSAATPVYEWDGGPISGGPVYSGSLVTDVRCDNTLVHLGEAGGLRIFATDFAGATGSADFDLYVRPADDSGAATGDPIARAESASLKQEALGVNNLKPGAYLVDVCAFDTVNGTFHGKVTYVGASTAAPDQRPAARVSKPGRHPRRFTGTARDDHGVAMVEIALQRRKGSSCSQLTSSGRFSARGRCGAPTRWLRATGTTSWSFELTKRLPKGSYAVFARATDTGGQVQAGYGKRTFRVS